MADSTPRFDLPFLAAGQAQKEVTHNEALARLDSLLHLAVVSLTVNTPPTDAVPGQAWIVAAGGSGDWAGHDGDIAAFSDGGWRFVAPAAGCLAWVADAGVFAVRTGADWLVDAWPVRALRIDGAELLAAPAAAVPDVSGGTTIDAEARAAILAILNVLRYMGLIAG